MPTFVYTAKSFNGNVANGSIEADNEAEVRVKLRAQKLIPVKIALKTSRVKIATQKSLGRGSVKPKDLQIFTRQLAVLISAGVPLVQSLEVLSQSARTPFFGQTIRAIATDISEGKKLAEAFGKQTKVFDRFFVNMVKAGEEGGILDTILKQMADYIEKIVKLKGKVKVAMVYPGVVLTIAFVVVAGLMIFVVPKFKEIFSNKGEALPGLTQLIVDMSDFTINYWYVILGAIFGSIYAFYRYYQTEPGRKAVDNVLVKIPAFGDLVIKSAIAKFSRTLSTLLGSGVGIVEAMEISASVSGNSKVEAMLLDAKNAIIKGQSMSVPMAQQKMFPPMVVQMIAVGEQSGSLDNMLAKIADFYEDEVDVAIGALTSMMEPLMVVILGGIIGFLVIALYLPIFKMAGGGQGI